MDENEFKNTVRGWVFCSFKGLQARIKLVEDQNLTQEQMNELAAMKEYRSSLVKL